MASPFREFLGHGSLLVEGTPRPPLPPSLPPLFTPFPRSRDIESSEEEEEEGLDVMDTRGIMLDDKSSPVKLLGEQSRAHSLSMLEDPPPILPSSSPPPLDGLSPPPTPPHMPPPPTSPLPLSTPSISPLDPITPRRALDEAFKLLDESMLDSTWDPSLREPTPVAKPAHNMAAHEDAIEALYSKVDKLSRKAKGDGSLQSQSDTTTAGTWSEGLGRPGHATEKQPSSGDVTSTLDAHNAAVELLYSRVNKSSIKRTAPSDEEGPLHNPPDTGSDEDVSEPGYATVGRAFPRVRRADPATVEQVDTEGVAGKPSPGAKHTGSCDDVAEPTYSTVKDVSLGTKHAEPTVNDDERLPGYSTVLRTTHGGPAKHASASSTDEDAFMEPPGYSRVGNATSVPKSNTWDKDQSRKTSDGGSGVLMRTEKDVHRKTSSANDVSGACSAQVEFPERFSSPALNMAQESGGSMSLPSQPSPPSPPLQLGGKPFEPVFDEDWTHVTSVSKLQVGVEGKGRGGGEGMQGRGDGGEGRWREGR